MYTILIPVDGTRYGRFACAPYVTDQDHFFVPIRYIIFHPDGSVIRPKSRPLVGALLAFVIRHSLASLLCMDRFCMLHRTIAGTRAVVE